METDFGIDYIDDDFDAPEPVAIPKLKKKGASERYEKMTQREHILLRPDTFIGSVEEQTDKLWVWEDGQGMVCRNVKYTPGLYKIFDEVLVNAADHKQRDSEMDTIKVTIDPASNTVSVMNNGEGTFPFVLSSKPNEAPRTDLGSW